MEVKLLVAYCKRKGGLILAEKSDPDFNRERLELVFNETAADLRSLDIECAALVETSGGAPRGHGERALRLPLRLRGGGVLCEKPGSHAVRARWTVGEVEMRAALESDGAVGPRFQGSLDELRKR